MVSSDDCLEVNNCLSDIWGIVENLNIWNRGIILRSKAKCLGQMINTNISDSKSCDAQTSSDAHANCLVAHVRKCGSRHVAKFFQHVTAWGQPELSSNSTSWSLLILQSNHASYGIVGVSLSNYSEWWFVLHRILLISPPNCGNHWRNLGVLNSLFVNQSFGYYGLSCKLKANFSPHVG